MTRSREIGDKHSDPSQRAGFIIVGLMGGWRNRMRGAILTVTLVVLLGATVWGEQKQEMGAAIWPDDRVPHKKLIQFGWDTPDTQWLRVHLSEIESAPFDGICVQVNGVIDKKTTCPMWKTFSREKWERKWFEPNIADLKACRFTRPMANFIMVGANPGGVDWFDDEGWRNIVDHLRIAAWIARRGGCKGIVFDNEDYLGHFQFMYRGLDGSSQFKAQPQYKQHTFTEYRAKARERGRQVMRAVAKEYPDITILCLWLNSLNAGLASEAVPSALSDKPYGLYPSFVDGWLDAMPPTVTVVDGFEGAYLFNSELEFLEGARMIRSDCQQLVAPENRAKYRAQAQVGFGIYLDAYRNAPDSPYYVNSKGSRPADRLRANVVNALRVADEYVWLYCEAYRWWPVSGREPMARSINKQTWNEVLPGCDEALRLARTQAANPARYARELVAKGTAVNLARNPGFDSEKVETDGKAAADWRSDGAPPGYTTWQDERVRKGVFAWDREVGLSTKGSARSAGINQGCFIQVFDVKPGENYAVQVAYRIKGQGDPAVRVRWQSPDGKWAAVERDQFFKGTGRNGDWTEVFGAMRIPEGVGKMVVLLTVKNQLAAEDVVWFDDFKVFRLE